MKNIKKIGPKLLSKKLFKTLSIMLKIKNKKR